MCNYYYHYNSSCTKHNNTHTNTTERKREREKEKSYNYLLITSFLRIITLTTLLHIYTSSIYVCMCATHI